MSEKPLPLPCPFCGAEAEQYGLYNSYRCSKDPCGQNNGWRSLADWNSRPATPDDGDVRAALMLASLYAAKRTGLDAEAHEVSLAVTAALAKLGERRVGGPDVTDRLKETRL